MYKVIVNNKNKGTHYFEQYVNKIIIEMSTEYIVERYHFKKDEFNHVLGAIVEYKKKEN